MKKNSPVAIKGMLVDAGLKATQQRIVILGNLMKRMDHPSPDQIYESIKKSNPSISLGTVYKTLDTLCEGGIIDKVMTNSGILRYDANTTQHNHIYCINTNEIIDFQSDSLEEMLKKFINEMDLENFDVTDFKLQINGIKKNKSKKVEFN